MIFIVAFVLSAFTTGVARDARNHNDILLKASSPFEDMIEYALAGDKPGLSRSLSAIEGDVVGVRKSLPMADAARYDSMLRVIRTAATAGEHQAVAMNAVEVYRLFIDNLETGKLKVPAEVSLLDYAGFKLHILTAARRPDWVAIGGTLTEAGSWWGAIRPKISSAGLRDAFDATIRGLHEAGTIQHLPMLNYAAQMDLDLVDLLEGYFERLEPGGGKQGGAELSK